MWSCGSLGWVSPLDWEAAGLNQGHGAKKWCVGVDWRVSAESEIPWLKQGVGGFVTQWFGKGGTKWRCQEVGNGDCSWLYRQKKKSTLCYLLKNLFCNIHSTPSIGPGLSGTFTSHLPVVQVHLWTMWHLLAVLSTQEPSDTFLWFHALRNHPTPSIFPAWLGFEPAAH